jgi:hypothetical protein
MIFRQCQGSLKDALIFASITMTMEALMHCRWAYPSSNLLGTQPGALPNRGLCLLTKIAKPPSNYSTLRGNGGFRSGRVLLLSLTIRLGLRRQLRPASPSLRVLRLLLWIFGESFLFSGRVVLARHQVPGCVRVERSSLRASRYSSFMPRRREKMSSYGS